MFENIFYILNLFSHIYSIYIFYNFITSFILKNNNYKYYNRIKNINKLKSFLDKKTYIIGNHKCRCKKLKAKCFACLTDNIINIECIDSWMKLFKNIDSEELNLILHTKGGNSDASDVAAKLLANSNVKINIYIPEYSYSAGTMVALAGDNIYMNWYSLVGPVDAQMDYEFEKDFNVEFPVKAIKEISKKEWSENDKEFLNSNLAESYHLESKKYLDDILKDNLNSHNIINTLLDTKYSHSYNFTKNDLIDLKLPVLQVEVPKSIMEIFKIYRKIKY